METPKTAPLEVVENAKKIVTHLAALRQEMEKDFREMQEGLDELAEEVFANIEPEKRPFYPKGVL
jgi:hypothetical protein